MGGKAPENRLTDDRTLGVPDASRYLPWRTSPVPALWGVVELPNTQEDPGALHGSGIDAQVTMSRATTGSRATHHIVGACAVAMAGCARTQPIRVTTVADKRT